MSVLDLILSDKPISVKDLTRKRHVSCVLSFMWSQINTFGFEGAHDTLNAVAVAMIRIEPASEKDFSDWLADEGRSRTMAEVMLAGGNFADLARVIANRVREYMPEEV